MGYFTDKVVVVVGAGSGIGRACARAYARAGARVHVVDLLPERARTVYGEIRTAGGRQPSAAPRRGREALPHPLIDRTLSNGLRARRTPGLHTDSQNAGTSIAV